MNVTDPENPAGLRPSRHRRIALLLLLATLVPALISCVEEPLPQRRMTPGDCLLELKLSGLANALQRCNKVVASFPKDPAPLNDRFLIHSLLGDNQAACADIRKAIDLSRQFPSGKLDPLLRRELTQRLDSCRD